ncbi:MAG: zinc carboxypeptidase [Leadbetterella sp.]|nr:zinc carboxypeptidase [Leadbetterella sp.]
MKNFFLSLLFLCLQFSVTAQVTLKYYLPEGQAYDSKIPTPKEFLGYEVGEQHATPYEVNAYFRELARHSDRMKVETYGRSFENRELLLVTFTSPANLANLENIKAEHKKLANPDLSKGLKIKDMPVVIWMGYSVHGNEASAINASLLAGYHLAAAQGPEIDALLKDAVILVDPCLNPDGATRFSTWVNSNKSQTLVSDGNSREFRETWPNGRTNHYWFDLNRDWLYQQLPESRGRLVKFYDWRPNILTDHHEMGTNSSFFFQPGIPARTHPITPRSNIDMTSRIGTYHAKALDKIGSAYYTKENYDDFYYGKGSTLPDVNGSIGILFEQASSRGHLQESINGPVSFPFTIRNQFVTTLSTLQAGKELRQDLLAYQKDFYAQKATGDVKAYMFGGSNDPISTWEMVNMLKRNQVDVYRVTRAEKINGLDFSKEDAYVVPLDQPQHRLITSMFEKRTTFQDSAFYDISAWTTPLCMNVPYTEVKGALSLGQKVEDNPFPAGKVVGNSSLAYLYEWDSYFASRATYELLSKGYVLKYATEPFTVLIDGKEKEFSYGTIQVTGKGARQLLETLAARDGITFYAQSTGLTEKGINLGSEKFRVMEKPSILMITGDGVDANDAGEVWHLLDTRVNLPLTFADISTVNRVNLSKYSHIVLNHGRYSELSAEQIKNYVESGGTLIALGDGATWAARNKIGSASFKAGAAPDTRGKKLPYASQNNINGAMSTAGTIFEARIDVSHPLCYGYKQTYLPVFKVNNTVFEDTQNAFNTPVMFTENPLMAGYVHPKNLERIRKSPAVIAQRTGSGQVISFTDNPNFRAFWYGTNKLFLNAIFFGKGIGGGRFGEEEE